MISLIISFVVAFAAAAGGALATRSAPQFYRELSRPAWAPPSWLFGPVWTLLYILMAISAWLVWKHAQGSDARLPLALYAIQLILNALWSWLFFAWRNGSLAEADIILLLVMIVLTIIAFARVDKIAACLLLPYLLWVSFATALTFAVVKRNPGLL